MSSPDEAGRPPRKLGRGLSEVSHLFLSGADKRRAGSPGSPNVRASDAHEADRERDRDRAASDARLWLPRALYLSVTSGENVRGKTLLSANVAYALATSGRRIAIVNADPDRPDIADMIGSSSDAPEGGPYVGSNWWGSLAVTDAVARSPLPEPPKELIFPPPPGFPIGAVEEELTTPVPPGTAVSAGSATQDPKELALRALEAAGRGAQIVVADTSPCEEASRTIWQVATLAIVVAEPGSEKMRSTYITVKRIHAANPCARIGLVLNCVRSYADGEDCFRKLAEVCREFLKINPRNYGYILHSPVVNEAYQRATPLVKAFPDSKAAKCVDAITGLIMMDESAIAKRRREVTFEECASKKGRLQALKS